MLKTIQQLSSCCRNIWGTGWKTAPVGSFGGGRKITVAFPHQVPLPHLSAFARSPQKGLTTKPYNTSIRGVEGAPQPKPLLVILAKPWVHIDRHLPLLAHAVSSHGMRLLMKNVWLNYRASTGKGSANVVSNWEDALRILNPVWKEKLKVISKLVPKHIFLPTSQTMS